MCGITGGVWTDPREAIEAATLARMTDELQHRGPDDEGYYHRPFRSRQPQPQVPGVALGFRRLSIIDLTHGNQPLSNEDGTVWLVFNGEIYNYVALRRRLEGSGHVLRTAGDGEAIVHLYEDEGLDCFSHLNGMFAIALWDVPRRRLVLARDRLGQKPLVYCHQPRRLLFASELKSLLQIPGVPRTIDAAAVDEYFTYQYIPHPRTIFREIRKLPPGHLAVWEDDRLAVRAYWQPDFQHEVRLNEKDAIAQVRELLTSSVEMRLQSDVPLGAFLSGGIDSSLVVALMQRLAQDKVKTFTISFPVREYDEAHHARLVAEHLGTEHHELSVTPDSLAILPKLVWHFDEPFADSSAVPTWYVSQFTREHVKVALTGDGGDELFVGYPRYRAVSLAAMIDRTPPLRHLLGARWWQRLPASARQKSPLRRWRRFTEALRLAPERRYLEWVAIFNEARRAVLYQQAFLNQLPDDDPANFVRRAAARASARDPVTRMALADLLTYLPCDLMAKVDIASMAHGLECRQPFLDHRVVEFAASLPLRLKFRHGRGKQLLRAAFGDLLPRSIWSRPKMGFGVPVDRWFRHELQDLTRDTLLSSSARCGEFLRTDVMQQLVDEHVQELFDHSYRLWALLVLELWLREWQPAVPPGGIAALPLPAHSP